MKDNAREKMFTTKQHNLPIKTHLQKMYSKFLREIIQWPKVFKPTLGVDVRETFAVLRAKINHAVKVHKKLTALREADVALDNLRDILWTAFDVKCISEGQYGLWIEDITVLGKMLGGWIKDVWASEQKSS